MLSGRLKRRVSATLTKPYLDVLEYVIREEVYISQAEAIKDALRRLFRHYGIWMEMKELNPRQRDVNTPACSREESTLKEDVPILFQNL